MKGIYKLILSVSLVLVMAVGVMTISGTFSGYNSGVRAQVFENSVPYNNNLNGISVTTSKYKSNDINTVIETVPNGGYVMLDMTQVDFSTPKDIAIFSIENNNVNTRITNITANVYLNGRTLSLGDSIVENEDEVDNLSYTMRFMITGAENSIKYNNSSEYVTDFEGLYEIYFYLGISTNGEFAQYPASGWYSYSFYLLDADNYLKDEQLPTINNVETRINEESDFTANRYYNYQYQQGQIKYPMLHFDPERYQMSIERKYNSLTQNILSVFKYTDILGQETTTKTDFGTLSFVDQSTGEKSTFRLKRDVGIDGSGLFVFDESNYYNGNQLLADDSCENYSQPILFNLGTYTITFKYQIFVEILNVQDGYFAVQEGVGNMAYAHERLDIFGQMAYFAKNSGDTTFNNFFYDRSALVSQNSDVDQLKSEYNNFVSTNQAPVWIEYIGQISSESQYWYSLNGIDWEGPVKYNKNTYFSTAGYYILDIKYQNANITGTNTYSQKFAFALTNKTPSVKVLAQDDEEKYTIPLNSEGFSRSKVKIQVSQPGLFDSAVVASYYRSADFGLNTKEYTYFEPEFIDNGNAVNDDFFEFTEAGKYYVKINYTRDSYSLYTFTIDKDDLSDYVVIRGVSAFNTSSVGADIQYRLNKNFYTDRLSVNKPFTVYVNEKPSHAKVTGTFYTYDIVYQENVTQTEIYTSTDGSVSYNFTDYIATNASAKQNYSNVRLASEVSELVSGAYIFNTQKLYVFEFKDSSGYTYMHPILLDFTTGNIIQTDADNIKQDVDDYNIVSAETHIYWGTHKSIRFPSVYTTENQEGTNKTQVDRNREAQGQLSKAYPDVFVNMYGDYQMLIPFDDVKVSATDLTLRPIAADYTDLTTNLFIYPDLEAYDNQEDRFKGEKYYYITLTDASGNVTNYQIEMNMDRSRGKMFTTKDLSNYDNADYRLALERAGSLGQLVFEWQDSEDSIYVIDQVSFEFYPLEYNTSLDTYPYANTPLETKVIYQKGADNNDRVQKTGNVYHSNIINMIPVNVEELVRNEITNEYEVKTVTKLITRPGKYVITRIYSGGDEDEYLQVGDSKIKTYTFYADNNPIIGTPDYNAEDSVKDFGEAIKLYLGAEEVPFDEFYREAIYNKYYVSPGEDGTFNIEYIDVALITNLLPIKIKVPESKYSHIQGNTAYSSTIPDTFDLTVRIKHYKESSLVEEFVYDSVDRYGWLVIDNIFAEGVYVLTIEDKALVPNTQLSPVLGFNNVGHYFAFEIQHTQPVGTILTAKEFNVNLESNHMVRSIDDEGNYVYSWIVTENSINTDNSDPENKHFIVERREKSSSGSYSGYSEIQVNQGYTLVNKTVGGTSTIESSLYLPAYGVSNNTIMTYQYKITYQLKNQPDISYSVVSPTMSDLDVYTELAQSVSSTSRNLVMFAFSDPSDEFYAKIDDTDIVIKRATKMENGTYSAFVELINGTDFAVEKRWKTSDSLYYTISLNTDTDDSIGEEYIYQIYYHYVGDRTYYIVSQGEEIKDFYGNTISLVIDKTPPSHNLKAIATTPTNATALTNNNLLDYFTSTYYKAEDGVYYYANTGLFDFAIDKDYEFTRPNVSQTLLSQDHESKSIYFRQYRKYDTESYKNIAGGLDLQHRAFQSLVPGDPEYYSGTTSRLRFNLADVEGNLPLYENWCEFGYNIGSFYDYLVQQIGTTEVSGYYEIVEIDEAGNHTIYTVLLNTTSPSVSAEISTSSGDIEEQVFGVDNPEINSLDSMRLTAINNLDSWYTLTFDQQVFNVTPDTDVDSILANINQLIAKDSVYTLKISNRFGDDLIINIRIGNADMRIGIASISQVGNENQYKVLIDNDTDVIKLKSLLVSKYKDGLFIDLLDENDNPIDSFGNPIDVVDITDRVFTFERGIYRFTIEDNFRNGTNAYYFDVNIGLSGNFELDFAHDFVRYENVRYTSGEVSVSAPLDLFTVEVIKDGVKQSLDDYIDTESNVLEMVLYPAVSSADSDVVSGAKNNYIIKVTNIATQQVQTEEFTIYNIFPGVSAFDSLGLSMNSVLSTARENVSTFTSKTINLEWVIPDNTFGYNVKLFRYTDNSDVPSFEQEISNNNITVSSEGVYEIRFTTRVLNNYRSLYFMIKSSTISMYQVYESLPNGSQNVVLPADDLLDVSEYIDQIKRFVGTDRETLYPETEGRLMVKNYFSCYSFIIEVEGDKNLKTNFNNLEYQILYAYADEDLNKNFQTQIVVVYGVSPYSYIEVFAVTKTPSNSKFLSEFGYVYEGQEGERDVLISPTSYDYLAIYDAPITLHWLSYYGVAQNKIYLKYYYNNQYIGSTYGDSDGSMSTFDLTLAGEYRFEFYDLAGNKQTFGSSNVDYLTILLKSEVLYYINGGTPIYGAVYNTDVILSIPDRGSYATGTLNVEIIRNGVVYELEPQNGVYNFTQQGVYEVRINASVMEGVSTKALKEVVTSFSIIRADEARFAYEFSNINGYVITKVIKNNVDITDTVKGNSGAIYSLLISEDSFGAGTYRIYVQGNPSNPLLEVQRFDFYVWVNSEIPVIASSIDHGATSVETIVITFNPYAIFEQIGNSTIMLDGKELFVVDSSAEATTKTLNIDNAGAHYITLKTSAGNTVLSFKVIKKDPLNTISIVLIVVGVIVLIVGTIIFVRMRVKMKIK